MILNKGVIEGGQGGYYVKEGGYYVKEEGYYVKEESPLLY